MKKEKLDPLLTLKTEELVRQKQTDVKIPVFVFVANNTSKNGIENIISQGVRVATPSRVHTADLTVNQIDKLTEIDDIIRIEMAKKLRPLSSKL